MTNGTCASRLRRKRRSPFCSGSMVASGLGSGPRGIGSKSCLIVGSRVVGFDVAHHDEGGIIGRVIGVVVPLQVIESHRIEVAEPADDGPMVGMAEIGLRKQRLDERALWVVLRCEGDVLPSRLLARSSIQACRARGLACDRLRVPRPAPTRSAARFSK